MSDDQVAFLRARLDEDEHVARDAASRKGPDWVVEERDPAGWGSDDPEPTILARGKPLIRLDADYGGVLAEDHVARHDPARVLAEVAAKRAIIKRYEHKQQSMALYPNQGNANGLMALDAVLRLMAAVYAEHADYQERWKPA